jgi:predicted nucleic acid-binding protein
VAAAIRKVLREPLLLTTVIEMEVAHYLVRQLGPVEGLERLETLLAFPFEVDPLDEAVVGAALEQLRRHSHLGVGGRDATLLASMARRGSRELWTHDAALQRVPGLKVRDPAAAAR